MKDDRSHTVLEWTPECEKQSNGAAERTVRTIKGQVRTMASALYARMGVRICPRHLVTTSLSRFAEVVLNRKVVGSNDKTAQERIKERRSLRGMCEFGERVTFKVPRARDMREQAGWQPSVWLGVVGRSEEAVDGRHEKIVTCYAVKRMPSSETRNWKFASQISGTPWRPEEPRAPPIMQPIPQERPPDTVQRPAVDEPIPKSL